MIHNFERTLPGVANHRLNGALVDGMLAVMMHSVERSTIARARSSNIRPTQEMEWRSNAMPGNCDLFAVEMTLVTLLRLC
jgi:hypothetical protein